MNQLFLFQWVSFSYMCVLKMVLSEWMLKPLTLAAILYVGCPSSRKDYVYVWGDGCSLLIQYTTDQLLILHCLTGTNTVDVEMHKTASSFGDDSRGSDYTQAYFQGYHVAVAHLPNHTSICGRASQERCIFQHAPIPQKTTALSHPENAYTYTHGNTTQWKKVECYFSEALK